ncbi:HK97-gp10 family putative phage morphogenesis protein [Collinsella aerofaciens]|uniref:HK97-gp10 family putative phage morphogenesis protein n=1 Tax=Collinsella aerofaciens TaxID=74426 RepID=UPI00319E0BF2
MAAPRKVGKEKWSAKNDTWTDRNGDTVSGMREKGFTRGSAKGLTASDISGLVEVRADNREAIANAIDRALVAALEEVGLVAEGYAKRACPVDTGRLRNSITHIVDEDGKCAVIGTNVEYAPFVELGTRRQKPQPYLKPAAEDHESTYRSIIRKHLGG